MKHVLFRLFSRRYELCGILLSSSRAVSEWGILLADPVVATAIFDCILYQCHGIIVRRESYHTRNRRWTSLLTATEPLVPARSRLNTGGQLLMSSNGHFLMSLDSGCSRPSDAFLPCPIKRSMQ